MKTKVRNYEGRLNIGHELKKVLSSRELQALYFDKIVILANEEVSLSEMERCIHIVLAGINSMEAK